jgi:hypothetical protein
VVFKDVLRGEKNKGKKKNDNVSRGKKKAIDKRDTYRPGKHGLQLSSDSAPSVVL